MRKVLARAETKVKGGESSAEKRNWDARQRGSDRKGGHDDFQQNLVPRRGHVPAPSQRDRRRPPIILTPLSEKRESTLKEILHTRLLPEMFPTKNPMGLEPNLRCEYHKSRWHDMENRWVLQAEIENLIQKANLKMYAQHLDAGASLRE